MTEGVQSSQTRGRYDTVGAGGITIPTELDQWIEAVNTIRQPDTRQQWVEQGSNELPTSRIIKQPQPN